MRGRGAGRLAPGGRGIPLRVLATLFRIDDPVARLDAILRERFPGFTPTFHSSGREAMRFAFAALAERSGRDEVVLPAYCCYSLAASAVAAGLRIRLVDVDVHGRIDPGALARIPLDRVVAVVVANLFGLPEPIGPIRGVLGAEPVAVIDDAAQAIGATTHDGSVGARGEVGVLSFGRGKPVSALGGGALLWREDRVGGDPPPWPKVGVRERFEALARALLALRVQLEASIDFADEELDADGEAALRRRLDAARAQLDALLAAAEQGRRLRDGLHAVIVGPPNAGKSSLLNALAGSDRAIVADLPGTTRDLLQETIRVDGVELTLVDTAGLREEGDAIEREGMRRARAELARADAALVVLDARDPQRGRASVEAALAGVPGIVWLHNKSDLLPAQATAEGAILVSARTGAGFDALHARLRALAGVVSVHLRSRLGLLAVRAPYAHPSPAVDPCGARERGRIGNPLEVAS